MKKLYPLLLLLFVGTFSFTSKAQSVSLPQASLSAAPMGTVENNGSAIGSIDFTEASGTDVPSTAFGEPNVSISINFQYVALAGLDINQITGNLLDYFTASYDVDTNILSFKQKDDIPGDWNGSVAFPMDVIQNSAQAESFNGFNANIAALGKNTNAEGNASIFSYTDTEILSVATHNELAVKVFPNPALGSITINIENNFAKEVAIYDLTGKRVLNEKYNKNNNTIVLDISHLASAVYVLKVTANDATFSTEIVKE